MTLDEAKARIAALEEALCIATCQMRDLVKGYTQRGLCEQPRTTMERLDKLIPDHEVLPL